MKFLVDQNRSPRLANALRSAGHDAVHTLDLGLERGQDEDLLLLSGPGSLPISDAHES